jgi:pilus assembly protein CpaE
MAEMLTPQDLAKLVALLRNIYNVVLIDTPTGVNDTSLAFFDAADLIIVVLAFDEATLRQTRAMSATFEQIGFRDKLRYLVNRSDSSGGLKPDVIAARLGRPADFAVVSDGRMIVEANNRGEPFVLVNPDAQASRDVAHVAEALATAESAVSARR